MNPELVWKQPDPLAMVRPQNDALRQLVKTIEQIKQAVREIGVA